MLELPESTTLARQLNVSVRGRTIEEVRANSTPHKLAFYRGDPEDYTDLLLGRRMGESIGLGALLEIQASDRRILLGDGARPLLVPASEKPPAKHQLFLRLDDGSVLTVSVQMYGAILAFVAGQHEDKYYTMAREKPQPACSAFDRAYFDRLRSDGTDKLSAKAFLATEQRIPGLGNGVLQDILFHAGIHPKRRMKSLSDEEYSNLFRSVKETIAEMTRLGGRDTEKDLYGKPGGYATRLSRNTVGKPCPVCGTAIQKASYMGGAIYWCTGCQPL